MNTNTFNFESDKFSLDIIGERLNISGNERRNTSSVFGPCHSEKGVENFDVSLTVIRDFLRRLKDYGNSSHIEYLCLKCAFRYFRVIKIIFVRLQQNG